MTLHIRSIPIFLTERGNCFQSILAPQIGATIWHRREPAKSRIERLLLKPIYVGCGYAIRLAAYRQVRGYLPIPIAYGMEESDLALQLFAADWQIYEAGDLRLLH